MRQPSWFDWLAKWASRVTGRPSAFLLALIVVLIWATTGPIFAFSDTWQMVINTATTIVTFFMVFLIQNTQTRDTAAIQIKLDELIRAVEGAHNALLDLEELNEEDLECIRTNYEKLAALAREQVRRGENDIDRPEVERSPES